MDNNNEKKNMIKCDDGVCIYYIPKDIFAHLVLRTQYPRRKYIFRNIIDTNTVITFNHVLLFIVIVHVANPPSISFFIVFKSFIYIL